MPRAFTIITDSACDLPDEYYKEHDIDCVPLGFTMDGVVYGGEDGEQMPVKEFYAKVRAGAKPNTFQISPEQAKLHIEKPVVAGQNVLVVSFSSGLSGTAGSYVQAANELMAEHPERKVCVVDSLCASMGQGLFLDYIVKKADEGTSLEETVQYAEDLKQHVCHYFTVDNLFHLKRGGRVSGAAAVFGTLLQIKPILHVDDEGHLIPVAKAMGRKKSLATLLSYMKKLQTLSEDDPIYISHGDCIEDAEYLASLIKAEFGERKFVINDIGPVIGSHTGAGIVALFFRGEHR